MYILLMSMHVTLRSDDCVNYTFYHVIYHILHCTKYEISVCLCVNISCTEMLWRSIWSSVALRIAQPGELCATKQSPSSKIRESKLWHIKEQFGKGSTSQQPQCLAMWQLPSRLQFENWTPRPSTNSPMTCDPSFSTAQSVYIHLYAYVYYTTLVICLFLYMAIIV